MAKNNNFWTLEVPAKILKKITISHHCFQNKNKGNVYI